MIYFPQQQAAICYHCCWSDCLFTSRMPQSI